MTNERALAEALALLQDLIDAGSLDGGTPTPCRDFDVDQLVEHIVDTHHLLATAAGSAEAPVEGTVGERHAVAAAASTAAWGTRGTDGVLHLGPNEVPAVVGLPIHVVEAYVHAWDLAAATGQDFEPSDDLTAAAFECARMFLTDDVRGEESQAPYGPAVEVDSGATEKERFIAFTGRDPRWSSASAAA